MSAPSRVHAAARIGLHTLPRKVFLLAAMHDMRLSCQRSEHLGKSRQRGGFLPIPMSGLWLTPRQSADRRRFHGPGIPGDTRRTCAKGRLFGLYSCLLVHFAGAQGLPSDRRPVDLHTRKSVIRGRPCVACHVQIRRCGVHRESHQRHRRVLVMKVRADRSDAAGCRG